MSLAKDILENLNKKEGAGQVNYAYAIKQLLGIKRNIPQLDMNILNLIKALKSFSPDKMDKFMTQIDNDLTMLHSVSAQLSGILSSLRASLK